VIQIFNVGAERMLGYRAADVVDKLTPADISDAQELIVRAGALSDEFTTAIAPGFEALVYKAMRGIEDIYDLTYIRADGTRLPALVSVTALNGPDGRLIGFLLIGTDNTARKQVEAEQALLDQRLRETNAELQAAKKAAEKANRAKSEFLSSMSHELRTPLNAVLGFAQLMASEVPPPPARQQRSIDQILKGGWYLLRLINEILDLATIESGKVTMSQEPMSVTDVLQDCKGMIEPQAAQRGIAMSFPRFDKVFYIHADRTRVKQVMINLLSNAIKYNASGGSVIVQCVATDTGRVRICVKDTGTGLSADQLAQLFQPFNRLGQQDGAEEGTGIGLVVTRQLVELMGGTIGVESAVGVGTVFWVEFAPAQAPALENIEEVALDRRLLAAPEASAQLTLLYVEDNPANLALVEQLIARRGDLKLVTAIDAYLGIELARAYVPDVILMDINLPGMSGYGALKVLRDDPLTTHIPVLALSANAVPRDIEKGIEAGFFRYLTKPIRVREFMDALDVALHHAADSDSGRPARLAGPVSQQSEESPC
jgi:signal transduction histidine kinase/ActR/RegA family two-component response regulator